MPAFEQMDRPHDAVLWNATGTDGFSQPTIGPLVELLAAEGAGVRWTAVLREVRDSQGNNVSIDATVIVDRDIAKGSIMWLGTVDSMPGTSEVPESNLMQVWQFNKTSSLDGKETHRSVMLMRFKDTPPVSTT